MLFTARSDFIVMEEPRKEHSLIGLPQYREYPRSPMSTSPVSSRRDSLRTAPPTDDPKPPSPTSPPLRLTRKRASSVDTDSANQSQKEDQTLSGAGTTSTISAGDHVCLCQPEPKIPRPRNGMC
jgi:HMG box factor